MCIKTILQSKNTTVRPFYAFEMSREFQRRPAVICKSQSVSKFPTFQFEQQHRWGTVRQPPAQYQTEPFSRFFFFKKKRNLSEWEETCSSSEGQGQRRAVIQSWAAVRRPEVTWWDFSARRSNDLKLPFFSAWVFFFFLQNWRSQSWNATFFSGASFGVTSDRESPPARRVTLITAQ